MFALKENKTCFNKCAGYWHSYLINVGCLDTKVSLEPEIVVNSRCFSNGNVP